jgi:GNAT superfamily N-acetyltransferase
MKFPSLSDLEHEQIQAIWEAREKGSSLFRSRGITYVIFYNSKGYIVTARNWEGEDIWYISSSPHGQHYAIEVSPEFRWKWVGTLLLRTKEAMDGILSHDWSGRYSRILFLIRKWYVPTNKVYEYWKSHLDEPISHDELVFLTSRLRLHVESNLSGDSAEDISPIVFRLRYFPGKARKFVAEYGL